MQRLEMESFNKNFETCKSDLNFQIEEADEKLRHTCMSLKSIEKNVTELQTEITSLRGKLTQSEQERENEKDRIEQQQREFSDLKEIENKYNYLVIKNTQIVDKYETKLSEVKSEWESKANEYEIKLCSILNEKQQITIQMEELHFKMNIIEKERDTFRDEIELLKTERVNLFKEITKLNELMAQYVELESKQETKNNIIHNYAS